MYEHDAPTSLDDYELVTRAGDNMDLCVYVSAVGGGTVGRAYAHNHWHYVVIDYRNGSPTRGLTIARGSDFYHPRSMTHRQAADAIADCIAAEVSA